MVIGWVGSEMGVTGEVRQDVVGTITGACPCAKTTEARMYRTAKQRGSGERAIAGGGYVVR